MSDDGWEVVPGQTPARARDDDGWEVVPGQSSSVGRIAAQGVRGVNQALYGAAAAPFDAAAWLTRKLGLTEGPSPIGEAIRGAPDTIATTAGQALGIEHGPMEPQTRGEKIAGKVGEGVGNVLSTVLPAGAIARGTGALGQATRNVGPVTRGVAETLASQPGGQLAAGAIGGAVEGATDSPIAGTAAALATPLAIAAGRGAISPVRNRLSPNEQALVQAAQREGIPLTPAQLTGSPVLKGTEAVMARAPFANVPMQGAFDRQAEAFARAATARTGQAVDNVAPPAIEAARQRLGGQFDNIIAQTPEVRLDRQFARDILRAEQDYGRRLRTDVRPVFESYMRDLEPATRPGMTFRMPSQTYATIRSKISEQIRKSNDEDLDLALNRLVKAFDNAMERSLPPGNKGLADDWRTLRRQYQAQMTIEKAAVKGTQEGRSKGQLGYAAFKQAVEAADRSGYARGRGQLNELSRVGDFLAPRVPNSGTPERQQIYNLLTGGALLSGGAATGTAIPALALGAALPYAASRLYNSPLGRQYLTNQMAGRTNFGALYGGQAAQGLLGP